MCKRIVLRHDKAPCIRLREEERFILGRVRRLCQNNEIQQSFVQLFHDLLCVAARDVVAQPRIILLECMDLPGQIADLVRFRQAKIQIPCSNIIQSNKLTFNLIRHTDQILSAVAQKDSLVRQFNTEAVPGVQLLTELVFQSLQGFGQCGLRHMERLRCPRHVFFSRHCKKVSQCSYFHINCTSEIVLI